MATIFFSRRQPPKPIVQHGCRAAGDDALEKNAFKNLTPLAQHRDTKMFFKGASCVNLKKQPD
jgi:hypothetical protein